MKISARARGTGASPTLAISARAKELAAAGEKVIDFSLGEPDFPTPPHIAEAGIRAIREGRTKYTAASGIPELKAAICGKLKAENGLSYKPSQVLVSTGAKFALYAVIQAMIDPGDEVVVPAPYWVSYPPQVELAGGRAVCPLAGADRGFKLTPDVLSEVVTKKTRALVLNSPCNPTGAVYSRAEVEALAEVVRRHDLAVISDEVYEPFLYDGNRPASPAALSADMYARTVTVNGHSKAYSMTGWRIGYAAGDEKLIAAAANIQSQSTSNPCTPSQYAALEALRGDQSCVGRMRDEFQRRRDYIVKALNAIKGVRCDPPGGAFYVFPDVSGLAGAKLAGQKVPDSAALAKLCIEEAKVALVPGEAFGAPGYLRLSYATDMDSIREGVCRLAKLFGGG